MVQGKELDLGTWRTWHYERSSDAKGSFLPRGTRLQAGLTTIIIRLFKFDFMLFLGGFEHKISDCTTVHRYEVNTGRSRKEETSDYTKIGIATTFPIKVLGLSRV